MPESSAVPSHRVLQRKIAALIGTYDLPLPSDHIDTETHHGVTKMNRRSHEFNGDSWMSWFITKELHRLYPEESSGLYQVRSAVLALRPYNLYHA